MGFNRAQDLKLVLYATILVASLDTSFMQECLPGNANTETGRALVGAEYATFVAKNYSECLTECTKNTSCESVNFILTTRICNLNSETKTARPDLFVQRKNSIYTTKTPNFFDLTELQEPIQYQLTTSTQTTTASQATQSTEAQTTQSTSTTTTQKAQNQSTEASQTTHSMRASTTQRQTTQSTRPLTTQMTQGHSTQEMQTTQSSTQSTSTTPAEMQTTQSSTTPSTQEMQTTQSSTTQSTSTTPATQEMQTTQSSTTQSTSTTPATQEMQTTQSWTIQSTSTTPSTQVLEASHPKSCLDILNKGNSTGDGEYWIDPANTGIPIKAYCDMTTDGGGWTIIKRTIFQTTSPPQNLRIQSYIVISEFNRNDQNIFPTSAAMLDIHQKMGFHQIHFYCHKKSVGRVVSIMTKNNTAGLQVVRFFTDDVFANTNFPEACGSFDRLPEDTSKLGQNCTQWKKGLNRWGKTNEGSRMLATAFYIKDLYYYGCSVNLPKVEYCSCDDNYRAPMPYSVQDHWQISVR